MGDVSGDGHAELFDDGASGIAFAYHNGDEASLMAKRENSSTAGYPPVNQARYITG